MANLTPSPTILVVDDDEITLEALEGFLGRDGRTVLCANNGQEALNTIAMRNVDLVLTDLQMPVMGGMELLSNLKNIYPDLPVIVISGAGDLKDSVEAFHLGAWDYIIKPFDLPTLKNSVSRALDQIYLLQENRLYQENLEAEITKRTQELNIQTKELEETNKQLTREIKVRREAEQYQRQLEKEIQKARNLESLGSLAGGIAHDFNNMLSALRGYLDYANLINNDNPELTETLSNAKAATQMASDLTRQLITFSKGGSPILKRCAIGPLIHQAIRVSAREAQIITFQSSIPKLLWDVNADLDQLSIMLRNIYFNAIESMPQGGVLSSKVSNVTINQQNSLNLSGGQYVQITIQDEGAGINKRDLQKIFDPYFTTKRMDASKGKGLGLSVSLSIVKKHGGNITISSQIHKGTVVTIFLPALPDLTTGQPGSSPPS